MLMVRLGDCFSIVRNGASIKQIDGADGLPITRIETISKCEIDRDKFGYANIWDEEKYKDYFLQDDDILMSHINSEKHLGKCAIYHRENNEKIIHGMNLLMLRANKEVINPQYAIYYFKTSFFKQQIVSIIKKSVNQASFTVTALKELKIPLLPCEEQNKIIKNLDKINEIINKRQEQLKKVDELVKSRFIEMFGDPQNNEKNWKMKTFKEICTVRQGLQIPISKRLTQVEENCYEYITVAYLHGTKNKEYVKNPKSTVICTKDDILMTRTGNTGMVITNVSGVFHNNFFLIDFDRDKYVKEFLVEYLNLDLIQGEIMKRAGTSTIPDLNHSEFYKILIYEPPKELQNQFVVFVEQTNKSKLEIKKSLDKLEILKKSLMQEYFG